MMIRLLITCVVLLITWSLHAQEKIALRTPITQASIADYAPMRLLIQVLPSPVIQVTIRASNGKEEAFEYPCRNGCTAMNTDAEVQATINALNSTVNMNTRTLWRRVFDRLLVDFPERFVGGGTVQ